MKKNLLVWQILKALNIGKVPLQSDNLKGHCLELFLITVHFTSLELYDTDGVQWSFRMHILYFQ